jgi:hypothetical protein
MISQQCPAAYVAIAPPQRAEGDAGKKLIILQGIAIIFFDSRTPFNGITNIRTGHFKFCR